ncbi:hypothetical protein, partial [Aerococcus sp. L_32]|uniref:hypothetical protein n=1 Tax=Aerococcus sp. L_32 TaxID=3422316 RepID=UPI003D6A3902
FRPVKLVYIITDISKKRKILPKLMSSFFTNSLLKFHKLCEEKNGKLLFTKCVRDLHKPVVSCSKFKFIPKVFKGLFNKSTVLQNFSTSVDNPSGTLINCPLNKGDYTQDFKFSKKITGLFTPCGKHLSKVGIIFIHILIFLWKTVFFHDIMNKPNEFKDSSY